MSIRINLLAEAQIAEDLRRRDPVKRAIFAGAFLVVLALVYVFTNFLVDLAYAWIDPRVRVSRALG